MANKAVFLDRDGTINVEKNYLYRIEDFEFLPGTIEALKILQDAGYLLIIITNQSGIARGYYTEDDFHILNDWMLETLKKQGISIAKVYYCPHHPEAVIGKYRVNCNCRKPKLGMFVAAKEEFDLDFNECFAIGDKIRDCSICESTGCRGYLINKNEQREIILEVKENKIRNVDYSDDLLEASNKIISM